MSDDDPDDLLFAMAPAVDTSRVIRHATGWAAAQEGMARAARKWSTSEKDLINSTIRHLAWTREEFTTDDVWEALGDRVPVTKGLAQLMIRSAQAGIIESTGERRITTRGGPHDHRQALVVWRSRLRLQDAP